MQYYQNNLDSTLVLLDTMRDFNVKRMVFSSSATVYGNNKNVPFREDYEIGGTTNPYGTSKLFIEHILNDLYVADNDFRIIILRYFKNSPTPEDPAVLSCVYKIGGEEIYKKVGKKFGYYK